MTPSNPIPARIVLDSFAVLAYLQDEPPASEVREVLDRARARECTLLIPVVNLGEVIYTTEVRQGPEKALSALALVLQWPLTLAEVDRRLALAAAHLKATTRAGYLDCFPTALAQQANGAVMTGDPDFRVFEGLVPIMWLTGA